MIKPRYAAYSTLLCFALGVMYINRAISPNDAVSLLSNVPISTPETRLLAALCLVSAGAALVLLVITFVKGDKASRIFCVLGICVTIAMSAAIPNNSKEAKFSGTFDQLVRQEVSDTCKIKIFSLYKNDNPQGSSHEKWYASGGNFEVPVEQTGVAELLNEINLQARLPESLKKIGARSPFYDVQYYADITFENKEDRSTTYTCSIRFRTDNYIEIAFDTYDGREGRSGLYYMSGGPITPERLQEIADKMQLQKRPI